LLFICLFFYFILVFSLVFQAECFRALSLGVCYEPYLPNQVFLYR
jgi:hypothetical protein